jgi:homoserine/homoserine lactone efflux protein
VGVFSAIRWAGAASYLVYLGCRLLFGPVDLVAADGATTGRRARRSLFPRGVHRDGEQPEGGCSFFSSLFPQFFADGQLSLGKAVVLCGSTLVTTFGCMMLYATAGERIQGLFRRARFRTVFQRGVGATLVGFGAGLALERK